MSRFCGLWWWGRRRCCSPWWSPWPSYGRRKQVAALRALRGRRRRTRTRTRLASTVATRSDAQWLVFMMTRV
eukprot:11531195-Alexandrium_andersonii.AAC.1